VAVKLGVMLVHVEAGLRSFDRAMPEEINRVLTDAISDLLLCTEQSGVDNLLREGVSSARIALVGNVMIDTLLKNREKAASSRILDELGLAGGEHAVVTLHRPSNVDDEQIFGRLLDALEVVQADRPVIFPIHPRTRQRLASSPLGRRVDAMPGMRLVDPLGYLEFLRLLSTARIVLTDSGGVQEETTILRVPCLTLRDNTERPVTVTMGTNRLVGTDPSRIVAAYREASTRNTDAGPVPPLWDGGAAERIVDRILEARS
jgi:UDP-N-acetylglucosamine 2-epimerase (non-hydrolysing)